MLKYFNVQCVTGHGLQKDIELCVRVSESSFFAREVETLNYDVRELQFSRAPRTHEIEQQQHITQTSSVFCISRLCRVWIFWIISYVLGSLPWQKKRRNTMYSTRVFKFNKKLSKFVTLPPVFSICECSWDFRVLLLKLCIEFVLWEARVACDKLRA